METRVLNSFFKCWPPCLWALFSYSFILVFTHTNTQWFILQVLFTWISPPSSFLHFPSDSILHFLAILPINPWLVWDRIVGISRKNYFRLIRAILGGPDWLLKSIFNLILKSIRVLPHESPGALQSPKFHVTQVLFNVQIISWNEERFCVQKIHLAERGFKPRTSRTAASALDSSTTAVPPFKFIKFLSFQNSSRTPRWS